MRNRPSLIGDYRSDAVVFRSGVQKLWIGLTMVGAVFLAFGGAVGPVRLEGELLLLVVTAVFASIGAIGLNIVTGMAGQVSLGHAFFIGLGAFTAAVLGGVEGTAPALDPETGELIEKVVLAGYQLDMLIWLPAAGLVAALAGLIVAPVATRLRGLYLAFVTLGLVFIGDHIFREAEYFTGGAFVGRTTAKMSVLGFRFDEAGSVFGVALAKNQKLLLLGLILLLVMGLAAKNLFRSKVGRAMAAVRDRDIAAEVMGIGLARYKLIAFVTSSFYAGIAGALLYTMVGRIQPEAFGFPLSIDYIAIRHDPHRGRCHRFGSHHGRLLPQGVPTQDRRMAVGSAVGRRGDLSRGRPGSLRCVPVRAHPLRPADHRVPHLRTARPVWHMDSGQELLEGMAILVLSQRIVACAAGSRPGSGGGQGMAGCADKKDCAGAAQGRFRYIREADTGIPS